MSLGHFAAMSGRKLQTNGVGDYSIKSAAVGTTNRQSPNTRKFAPLNPYRTGASILDIRVTRVKRFSICSTFRQTDLMFRRGRQYRAAFLANMADALESLPLERAPGRAAFS